MKCKMINKVAGVFAITFFLIALLISAPASAQPQGTEGPRLKEEIKAKVEQALAMSGLPEAKLVGGTWHHYSWGVYEDCPEYCHQECQEEYKVKAVPIRLNQCFRCDNGYSFWVRTIGLCGCERVERYADSTQGSMSGWWGTPNICAQSPALLVIDLRQ